VRRFRHLTGQHRTVASNRRLGLLLTLPRFLPLTGPAAMRSATLMEIAVRVMGNLVTTEDTDLVARAWRRAGGLSRLADRRKPFS